MEELDDQTNMAPDHENRLANLQKETRSTAYGGKWPTISTQLLQRYKKSGKKRKIESLSPKTHREKSQERNELIQE